MLVPRETANEFEVVLNIFMGTLGAVIWDMFISVPEDIILIRRGLKPVTIFYFSARVSALACIIQSIIGLSLPIAHCSTLQLTITCCWIISSLSSLYVFLRRIQSLYRNSKLIKYLFLSLYLAASGTTIIVLIGSNASYHGNTKHCVNIGVEGYVAAAPFMLFVFTFLTFLGASYRIAKENRTDLILDEVEATWKFWIVGKVWPRASKAVLHDGQPYFLFIVFINVLLSILIAHPSVPKIYGAPLIITDIAITSAIACRIHRILEFPLEEPESQLSTLRFNCSRTTNHTTTNFSDLPRSPNVAAFTKSNSVLLVLDDSEEAGKDDFGDIV